ncbi:MAG TPA: SET domain-containing protein-lysine N-methyltransferase [Candidatus Udaeobacter sp.]|nr:SET domain-containing protein-lysine N-methyltransferase [Candidatus Udaeobacter sp.]
MMRVSYLSSKTAVRDSTIHGRGLFAIADFAKDEIVAVKGGHIVDRKNLREKITPLLGPVEIQIDKDLFIAPVTEEERESSMLYSNHSCDANLGVRGEITFVAMREIRAGEELTHDWAMTDDDDYSVECKCGTFSCRGILTGKDWRRPDLQRRYAGYFSAYLERKIAALHKQRQIVPLVRAHVRAPQTTRSQPSRI